MLPQTKDKDVYAIIKSGLVGAFALIGLSLVFVITSARSQAVGSLVEAILKIAPSIPGLFIIIGGVGFILGLVLRRRFPIIQRGILPLAIAMMILAIPLGFVAWFIHTVNMNIELPPLSLKLADCTNDTMRVHIKIPRGHAYQLELRLPNTQLLQHGGEWVSSYRFSGRLRILSNGISLADLPISSDKAWLTGSGYVLTGVGLQNTNVPPLSDFIKLNETYDFEISLDPAPTTNSSVWLYSLQSGKDIK